MLSQSVIETTTTARRRSIWAGGNCSTYARNPGQRHGDPRAAGQRSSSHVPHVRRNRRHDPQVVVSSPRVKYGSRQDGHRQLAEPSRT
ncbi:hypothetical protein F2981_09075 [Sinorhizobium meliloti]|nr:hypothetical protein [Sinorhizobium meliloti]